MVNPDLQQKVLESLFNVPEMSRVVDNISWKKVVKQVESFGQGLSLSVEGTVEPSLESRGNIHFCIFFTLRFLSIRLALNAFVSLLLRGMLHLCVSRIISI